MRLWWQEEPNAPPPPHSVSAGQSPPARGSLYPSPFAATQGGWCEPGAQRVSHTLAPFTVLNGPQRPGVCLRGRLGCHLARTRGGNQPFIRLGFNTIHFIFPTTENWIKAARVRGWGEVRRSGGWGGPPRGPPTTLTSGRRALLTHLGHISWHESHLGEELAQGRVLEVQNTSLSQLSPPKSWRASLCLDDPHIWVQSWVLAASSQEQWPGHTWAQTLVSSWWVSCPAWSLCIPLAL